MLARSLALHDGRRRPISDVARDRTFFGLTALPNSIELSWMTDAYYSLCTFFDVCHASAVGEGGRDGGRATGCSAAGGSPESPVGPFMSAFSPLCGCDIAGAGGATRSSFFVVVVAPVASLRIRLAAQQLRPDPKRPHAEYAMRDSEIFLASASASVRPSPLYLSFPSSEIPSSFPLRLTLLTPFFFVLPCR